MKNQTNTPQDNLTNFLTATAIVSLKDKRLAKVLNLTVDSMELEIEGVGRRQFLTELVMEWFFPLMNVEEVAVELVKRVPQEIKDKGHTDAECYKISKELFNHMVERFPEVSYGATYKAVRDNFSLTALKPTTENSTTVKIKIPKKVYATALILNQMSGSSVIVKDKNSGRLAVTNYQTYKKQKQYFEMIVSMMNGKIEIKNNNYEI